MSRKNSAEPDIVETEEFVVMNEVVNQEVVVVEDDPAPPRPVHDRRTKTQLLERIAELEAEQEFVKQRLESNEEYLQHQRRTDNAEGERLLKKAKAERDQARGELAKARTDLATQELFVRGLGDRLNHVYDQLAMVRQDVAAREDWVRAKKEFKDIIAELV